MKRSKTVISTQTQQPPVPEPDASVDSKHLSRRVRVRVPGRPVAQPEPAAPPDQPFLASSGSPKGDPFSYPPTIYDPDADILVHSAQSEISELLPPETDAPPS